MSQPEMLPQPAQLLELLAPSLSLNALKEQLGEPLPPPWERVPDRLGSRLDERLAQDLELIQLIAARETGELEPIPMLGEPTLLEQLPKARECRAQLTPLLVELMGAGWMSEQLYAELFHPDAPLDYQAELAQKQRLRRARGAIANERAGLTWPCRPEYRSLVSLPAQSALNRLKSASGGAGSAGQPGPAFPAVQPG